MQLPHPYLLFLADATEPIFAKTAFGLRDWAPELCVGEFALPTATISTGLPILNPTTAYQRGARALVIAVAPIGGQIHPSWIPALIHAMESGLDLVSGMHTPLRNYLELKNAAARLGRRLIDVRTPPTNLPIGNGLKRKGKRLLTVGTDCALGKKYTALSLTKAFQAQKVDATFRATGQTGILIAGEGIPIDAVVADFISGAAETLSPDAPEDHWDIVEGQGSLFHPSYSGVSLGLLHGTQPDVIVLCHEAGRKHLVGFPEYPIPELQEVIDLHLTLARRTNPKVRCAGISLNTASVSTHEATETLNAMQTQLGIPVADPMRSGKELDTLVAACLKDSMYRGEELDALVSAYVK